MRGGVLTGDEFALARVPALMGDPVGEDIKGRGHRPRMIFHI